MRRSIDAHGAVPALVAILQARNVPQLTKERVNSVAFYSQILYVNPMSIVVVDVLWEI